MAIGKKGIFLTLTSLLMVVAIMTFMLPSYEPIPQMSRILTVRTRVLKANDFVRDTQDILAERVLVGSSYGALRSIVSYVNASPTKEALEDFNYTFREVLMNGTVNNEDLYVDHDITYMRNNTLTEKLEYLRLMAGDELQLTANFTVLEVNVYQNNDTSYDKIGVDMNLSIFVDAGLAIWNTTTVVTAMLDVDRLYDPYYIFNADIPDNARIIQFTARDNWSVSQVYDHIDDINYTFEPDGPSYLMRLENLSNGSVCCGIESFINPDALGIVEDEPWSYADYCYYGRVCNDSRTGKKSLWNVTGLSTDDSADKFYGFKLEIYHLDKYNLSSVADKKVVEEP